jgi:hypothetical protein
MDAHFPHHHPDIFKFLIHLKNKYKWHYSKSRACVNMGDELNNSALSFHGIDPDGLSSGHELFQARECIKALSVLFPKMMLCESNHGSLAYRRAKANGMSKHYIKSYKDQVCAPKGWEWAPSFKLKSGNQTIFFAHYLGDAFKQAQARGMSVIQGHAHSEQYIKFCDTDNGIIFGAQGGCLINDRDPAFSYNKLTYKRPLLGIIVVVNGKPILERMELNEKHRWVGK